MASAKKPRSSGGKSGRSKKDKSPKPGSDPGALKEIGGKGDFGVPMGTGPSPDRDYVTRNTKMSDPGNAHPMDWEQDGVRDHGVGVPATGPGSGSGGDLDPDVIGVGSGGSGVATSGSIHDPSAADDVSGDEVVAHGASAAFAVGGPAQGLNETGVGHVGGSKEVEGTFVDRDADMVTGPPGEGADAVTNPAARGDDSFAGEVSSGEAQGQDNPLDPARDPRDQT